MCLLWPASHLQYQSYWNNNSKARIIRHHSALKLTWWRKTMNSDWLRLHMSNQSNIILLPVSNDALFCILQVFEQDFWTFENNKLFRFLYLNQTPRRQQLDVLVDFLFWNISSKIDFQLCWTKTVDNQNPLTNLIYLHDLNDDIIHTWNLVECTSVGSSLEFWNSFRGHVLYQSFLRTIYFCVRNNVILFN